MTDPRRRLPSVSRLLEDPAVAAVLTGTPRAAGGACRARRDRGRAARAGRRAARRRRVGRRRGGRAARAPRGRRCAAASTPPGSCCTPTWAARRSPRPRAGARCRGRARATPPSSTTSARGARGDRQRPLRGALLTELTGADGRAGRQQLRRGARPRPRHRGRRRRRGRLARRADRDRRRLPHPRDHGDQRRRARRGRHHQPHPARATTSGRCASHARTADARTRDARDDAPSAAPRAILKVHRSNFRQEGFVAEAALAELVALGRKRRGSPVDLRPRRRPDARPRRRRPGGGTDAARPPRAAGPPPWSPPATSCWAGRRPASWWGAAPFVARCRANPLARAVRADKLTLGGARRHAARCTATRSRRAATSPSCGC